MLYGMNNNDNGPIALDSVSRTTEARSGVRASYNSIFIANYILNVVHGCKLHICYKTLQ